MCIKVLYCAAVDACVYVCTYIHAHECGYKLYIK